MSALPRSAQEAFDAVEALIADLRSTGREKAAAELEDGYGRLNGLTDGWMDLLASITRVEALDLTPEQRAKADWLHDAAYYCVHRRKRRWWRFW